jgi:hypothetical protein
VLAFYLSIVLGIALSWLRNELSTSAPLQLRAGFVLSTLFMICFAVFGMRAVYSLPISLTANWIWRITELRGSENYISATRWSLLLFAALPAWLIAALLSVGFRP